MSEEGENPGERSVRTVDIRRLRFLRIFHIGPCPAAGWTGRTMSSDFSLTPYYFKEAERRFVLLAALHFPSRSEVPPDAALPQRLGQKDVRAFEQLYTLHSHTVYALVFRIVQQSSIAEEVAQDVFLHLWRNAAQYDSAKGAFVPWLLTLARNRALDHLRLKSERQRRREELPQTLLQIGAEPGYEEAPDEKRRAERVGDLMGSLYPQQKRAIEMAYFEGLSHSEIAAALKEPLGTVKSWIRNGLQRLKEGLQATL